VSNASAMTHSPPKAKTSTSQSILPGQSGNVLHGEDARKNDAPGTECIDEQPVCGPVGGGRAVPPYTPLAQQPRCTGCAARPGAWLSNAAIGLVVAAVCLGVSEHEPASGVLLLVSAALLLVRMSARQSWKTIRYPAWLMLHVVWT